MVKYKNQIIGVIGVTISIILTAFYSFIRLKLIKFIERYKSLDHQIDMESINSLEVYLFTLILLIIIFSIIFFFNLNRKLLQFISNFIDLFEMKKFFLTDDICIKKIPAYLLVISIVYGLLLHFYILLFNDPAKEGIIEKLSSSLFLISGIILIVSSTQINKNQFLPKIKKQIVLILIVFSGLFFFIFGEEISWGQRIFNWESFGIFNDYNYQKETNSHNFFNPLFKFIYPIIGLSTFIGLVFIWFFPINKSYLFQLFIPPPSLFFIVFLMACSSFRGHSEVYEELLAMFLLLYSIRIFICLRFHLSHFPKNQFSEIKSLNHHT